MQKQESKVLWIYFFFLCWKGSLLTSKSKQPSNKFDFVSELLELSRYTRCIAVKILWTYSSDRVTRRNKFRRDTTGNKSWELEKANWKQRRVRIRLIRDRFASKRKHFPGIADSEERIDWFVSRSNVLQVGLRQLSRVRFKRFLRQKTSGNERVDGTNAFRFSPIRVLCSVQFVGKNLLLILKFTVPEI